MLLGFLFDWIFKFNWWGHLNNKEASKEAPRQYNLRRNARIWSYSYQVNNMPVLTKKFKNLLLEDVYISKDFEAHEDGGATH